MGETKMLVVVLLLVIIFLGITAFLFYLEKRLAKAEQELKTLQENKKNKEAKQ